MNLHHLRRIDGLIRGRAEDGVVDDFFAYFELTKLWSIEAPRASIAEGVTSGLFAYSVGVNGDSRAVQVSDSSLVRLRTPLSADEVDLGPGAALLSIAEAEALTRPEESVVGGVETRGQAGTTETAEPETPPAPAGDGRPETRQERRVSLQITATEDDLHTLQRALTGLRDVVKPGSLRIELKVIGEHPEEAIDQIQFQNRVRQHLEEDQDVSFSERWD